MKRAERKATRQKARQDKRAANAAARNERKMVKTTAKAEKKQAKAERIRARSASAEDAAAAERNSRVEDVRESMANLPPDFSAEQLPVQTRAKAVNYLKKRGRVIESETDPELLAAQFKEERARHIAERHSAIESQIDEDPGLTDEEKDARIPDFEDVDQDIMEEEANEFAFNGDDANYLDPDSIAMLFKAGQSGVEKYKEHRFKQGKKAFGRTAAQDKAIKERKAKAAASGEPGSGIGALLGGASSSIEEDKTKAAVKNYTPYIIGGVLLIIGVTVAITIAAKHK